MFGFVKKEPPPLVSAIIVAAGGASRMEGIDKQRVMIEDMPVVARSISLFDACPLVAEVVLVCREAQIADYYALVQDFGFAKVSSVVKGGAHRQESVFNGVMACKEDTAFFAIHDGARPLVTPEEISRCIQAAYACGAAALGSPVKDTIKVCGPDGRITATPDRSQLYAIATPQVFDAGLYRQAMNRALDTHCVYTDDCQLLEKCGHPVTITPGSHQNIKITTPEDIAIAQAILAFREGASEWTQYE